MSLSVLNPPAVKQFRIFSSLLLILVSLVVAPWQVGEAQSWSSDDPVYSFFSGEPELLRDRNGDGTVSLVGFGDSITFGYGDGTEPGAPVSFVPPTNGTKGYLARLRTALEVQVENRGVPGESLVASGVDRIVEVARASSADLVLFLEGTNDSGVGVSPSSYERALQRVINVARAFGKQIVIGTPPPPCCNHSGQGTVTRSYNNVVRTVANVNNAALVDYELAWDTTCESRSSCELYNLPEGLHPNTKGYDVMSQLALAELMSINLFQSGGANELESALGWPEGSVVVKPEVTPSTN